MSEVKRNFEGNPKNAKRAEEIEALLAEYGGGDPNDVKATVSDFLADLMIFCAERTDESGKALEFDSLLESAERHFEGAMEIDADEAVSLMLDGYCDWNEEDDMLELLDEEAESDA